MLKDQFLLFLVATSMVAAATAVRAEEIARPELAPALERMLKWLPADTETLMVANGPFELAADSGDDGGSRLSPQSFTVGILELHKGLLKTRLKGQKVLTAVEGSRDFRPPKDIGLMTYHGCHLFRFDESARRALEDVFKSCLDSAAETTEIDDHKVAVFREERKHTRWVHFVALPEPTLLLCATSKKYLTEVLARMKHPGEARAFPGNLPEWKHVDAKASVWAIRHYRKERAAEDPSSPLNPRGSRNDPAAIGFLLFWNAAAPEKATAIHLTAGKRGVTIAKEQWKNVNVMEGVEATVTETEPGTVKAAVSFTEETASFALLLLLAYLGHATWL